MIYQSPLHIIKGLTEEGFEINQPNLIRLRKRLFADLSLTGETTITVNDRSFTKDAIIKTFDKLINDPDLNLHEFIYEKKKLLEFLEDDTSVVSATALKYLHPPEPIREKLFLLIEEKMTLQFKKSISKRDFALAAETVLFFNDLEEERKQVYYEVIHKHLTGITNLLIEITEIITSNTSNLNRDEISKVDFNFLADEKMAVFLNTLPIQLNEAIIQLLNSIINLMFYYQKQHKYDHELLSKISHMLMSVRQCEENQCETIRNNHKVYAKSVSTKFFPGGPGLVAVLVIIMFRFLAGSNSCNDNPNHVRITYPSNYSLVQNKPHSINFSDSSVTNNPFLDSLIAEKRTPQFNNLNEYLKEKIHYPQKAINEGKTGTVHVEFIVEADGILSDIKAIDSIGGGCEQEAIRVIKSMPAWEPGTYNGKPIRTKMILPVKFILPTP